MVFLVWSHLPCCKAVGFKSVFGINPLYPGIRSKRKGQKIIKERHVVGDLGSAHDEFLNLVLHLLGLLVKFLSGVLSISSEINRVLGHKVRPL